MISDEALSLAIERGVITAEQAEALRGLAQDHPLPPPPPLPPPLPQQLPPPLPVKAVDAPFERTDPQDDEAVRFVTSFADIFVSLGFVLFFSSAAYLIRLQFGGTAMWGAIVVLAWLAAELFSRKLRLALPSILLLALFSFSVFMTTTRLFAEFNPTAPVNWWHPADGFGWILVNSTSVAAAGLMTAAVTGLHYLRFRVPITIAAMAAALIATVIGTSYWLAPDLAARTFNWLLLTSGLIVFLVAMRFDMTDLKRETRRTDIAFWLHLLAAPLIVHPLLATVGGHPFNAAVGLTPAPLDSHVAITVLAIFLGLGLVSLIIDRRALLVSGLTYAGIAFGTLLHNSGVTDNTPAATLLALGAFILFLSALWRVLRGAILRLLPRALVLRLPHSHLSVS